MLYIHFLLLGAFTFYYFPTVNSIICYQCTDCPEPFTTDYPYVTLTNNTNFLAQCTKSVINLGDGRRLISKGSIFYCPTETTTGDAQLYCCAGDYCNSTAYFGPSIIFLFLNILVNMQDG